MFFYTHVYYAKKINKNIDSLSIIGSMLPDLALTSAINWDHLHKKKDILPFISHLKKNYPPYQSLATGINYHNTLDYLTHLAYKHEKPGYAYKSINQSLVELVAKAFDVEMDIARIISHNFIESAVEMYVIKENQELIKLVKNAIKNTDKKELAKIMATFYAKSQQEFLSALTIFFTTILKYDLTSIDEWVLLWNDLSIFLFKKEANKVFTKHALNESISLTKHTRANFIANAITIEMEIVDAN